MSETLRAATAGRTAPLWLAVITLLLLVGASAPAQAHAQVVSVYPPDGSNPPVAPDTIVITLNETPQELGTQVQVDGPNGPIQTRIALNGHRVDVALPAGSPAGSYRVTWRITSADGHPIEGGSTFEADRPGTGGGGVVPTGTGSPTSSPEETTTAASPTTTSPTTTVSDPTTSGSADPSDAQTSTPPVTDTGQAGGLSPGEWLVVGGLVVLGAAATVTAVVMWRRRS